MKRTILGRAFGNVFSFPALGLMCVGERALPSVGGVSFFFGMPPGWEDMLIQLIYCLIWAG